MECLYDKNDQFKKKRKKGDRQTPNTKLNHHHHYHSNVGHIRLVIG